MENRDRETAVPTAKQLTIETVNLDDDREMDEFDRQVIAAGMERVRAEIRELRQKGLLDAQFPRWNIFPPKDIQK
jgi:hypothetical protein